MSVDNILQEIQDLAGKKVDSGVFESKMAELKSALDTRTNAIAEEVKSTYGTIDKTIEAQKEEYKTMLAEAVKEMGKAFSTNNGKKENDETPDIKTYGASFGEFLLKVKSNDMSLKVLAENVGANGGYLVPRQWSNNILSLGLENSFVRRLGAQQINLTSPSFDVPTIQSTSRSSSYYGGVNVYWGEETSNFENVASQPKFGKVSLNVNKMIGYTEAYEDFTRDSIISVGPMIQRMFGEAIGFEEDYVFLNGDGVGKPMGIFSSPCRATVSRGTASQIHTTDVINMMSRFCGNLDNAYFIANQTVLPYLYTLRDPAGNYIWMPGTSGNISGRSPGTLYGIPVIISEKVPALGTEGDFSLNDFGQYLIGDLQGLRIEESRDFKFGSDKRVWKFAKRLDGKPWISSAITPKLGGSTLSYHVTLV